ncbi:uncharacterized protein [Triticum aestivum]|nr:uncharacterized protein LOC123058479 isoform X2 [Triticum aestivum]
MENPMLAAVINNLPHLLDNPDLVQRVLDGARADLHLNGLHLAEAAAQLRDCLRAEGRLRTLPEPTEEQRIACAMLVDAGRASYRFFLKQHWLLGQLVGSLLVIRAAAAARSRAHLLPGVLLAAVSAAVVVYVSTRGVVVPGFRSLVRFSLLTLDFLFAPDRPRARGRARLQRRLR